MSTIAGTSQLTVHAAPSHPSLSKDDASDLEKREDATTSIPYVDEDDYPDGGLRAWSVLAGGICNTIATFGFVNAWGSFQSYYEQNSLSTTSPSSIAWIGSIQYALTFLPALVTGRMFDIGYFKVPLFSASALLVISTFLLAHCTQYWHFLVCQGFAVGLASGVIFGPTVSVLSHWFKKRRGMALGLLAVGSSIGGTVFPIAFRKLLERVGFPWTMRILGFMIMAIMITPNLTLRRRLPPVNVSGGLINFRPFKQPALFLYTLASFLCFLGLYTVLTYIDSSAVRAGLSEDFSFYLVAIANASSAIGRAGSGLIADRIGCLTIMIPFTFLTGVLTYVWPFVHTKGALIAIAVVYGIGAGVFGALLAAPVTHLGDIEDVGRRVGLFMGIIALGALAGPPISGAINKATDGFVSVGMYAGSCIMLAVGIMIWSRYLALGGWKGKF